MNCTTPQVVCRIVVTQAKPNNTTTREAREENWGRRAGQITSKKPKKCVPKAFGAVTQSMPKHPASFHPFLSPCMHPSGSRYPSMLLPLSYHSLVQKRFFILLLFLFVPYAPLCTCNIGSIAPASPSWKSGAIMSTQLPGQRQLEEQAGTGAPALRPPTSLLLAPVSTGLRLARACKGADNGGVNGLLRSVPKGKPCAITSRRRASATGISMFMSASRTLWQIRPPIPAHTSDCSLKWQRPGGKNSGRCRGGPVIAQEVQRATAAANAGRNCSGAAGAAATAAAGGIVNCADGMRNSSILSSRQFYLNSAIVGLAPGVRPGLRKQQRSRCGAERRKMHPKHAHITYHGCTSLPSLQELRSSSQRGAKENLPHCGASKPWARTLGSEGSETINFCETKNERTKSNRFTPLTTPRFIEPRIIDH